MALSAILLLIILVGLFPLWGQPPSQGRVLPVPWPLPFLGTILQLDHRAFSTITLCGYEAVREALVDQPEAFSCQGQIVILDSIFQGTDTMRDFGMGKRSMWGQIKQEAQGLVEELRNSQGTYLDPTFLFNTITANIINSIIFDERFNYQDPRFLFFFLTFYETFKNSKIVTKNIERHWEMLDPSAPKDFIDSFLPCMDKASSDLDWGLVGKRSEFHHKNLVHTVLSLFFAGVETSSTTLCYKFLLLLKNPDVLSHCYGHSLRTTLPPSSFLEKVQTDLHRMMGQHLLPAFEGPAKMPYTDAVIIEVQRFIIKDTQFPGYHLPKVRPAGPQNLGWKVLSACSLMLHVSDGEGNFRKQEAFIPFSMDKLKTYLAGGELGLLELFLFLTSMLPNFLGSPKAPEDINLTLRKNMLAKLPSVFQLCFLPHWGRREGMQSPSEALHPAPTSAHNESVEAS
ncbi:hypothetical protein HPG69_018074 [Diceros bicornis minor]|uniref:Cytochrome P450 n=1 Tax=Diceros bicornis minor TaxID=77932 RepID=A0A7J7F7X9_DICBM|nr:hypothetical protein HPG69_018074 [Diceros bicornis minor]